MQCFTTFSTILIHRILHLTRHITCLEVYRHVTAGCNWANWAKCFICT